ncbi:MAG TPA: GDP-L-fucose synthase [bacterium]|nr:GDP-L-fucose synthase [bacterium]
MKTNFWHGKKVLITGGHGFLGKHVISCLGRKGKTAELFVFHKREFDLRIESDVKKLFRHCGKIDFVIHLAGDVGGIGYNRKLPGDVFYNNLMMNTLLMEYSKLNGTGKFVGIGTVCSYPKLASIPFKEEDLWSGYPEETNASYGLAKKMMLVQGQAYRKQFNFNAIHLLMINLYGPGDNFDVENSHVISGLIRKFDEAKLKGFKEVTAWGTGKATREFLYVEDAAEAIIAAAERYDKPEPVNIGSGIEISIRDLADLIAELSGFSGNIKWDSSKPDGQPRRRLDVYSAEREFGFRAKTSLEEGLEKTIEWYRKKKGGE